MDTGVDGPATFTRLPSGFSIARIFPNKEQHDPADLDEARRQARRDDGITIGLLFQDAARLRYDDFCQRGLDMTADERLRALDEELDRFAV